MSAPDQSEQELRGELRRWVDRASDFAGWDFSELGIEPIDPGPPWEYLELAAEAGEHASSALDLGTGGGERLASIRERLPSRLVATEHWQVNAPIAHTRLHPLGVEVIRALAEHAPYPFGDESFDLILNRHEALVAEEVPRLLRPGGRLVMQQVGPHDNLELQQAFPRYHAFEELHDAYLDGLRRGGLTIEQTAEHHHRVAHRGIGQLAYDIAVTPWNVADFDVDADFEALRSLAASADARGRIIVTECRWYVVASKPR